MIYSTMAPCESKWIKKNPVCRSHLNRLYLLCKDQVRPIPIGPPWTFSRLVAITDINAFSFVVCDCDCCDEGSCIYSAVATVTSIETAGFTSINNAYPYCMHNGSSVVAQVMKAEVREFQCLDILSKRFVICDGLALIHLFLLVST